MGTGKSIRHELRTPLNHIIGYGEMLIEDLAVDGTRELLAQLDALCDHGKLLLALVNAPPNVDEQNLAGVFGDWRTPVSELESMLRRLRPVMEAEASDWLADLIKIEQASGQLHALFEGIDGPLEQGDVPAAAPLAVQEPPAREMSELRSTAPADPGPARPQPFADGVRGNLLVVDDNASNLELMQRRLVREGYTVTVAADGETALDLMADGGFDVVLLDVLMPGINGIDVLKAVRERFSQFQLPIIMVTAKHGSENIVEALQLGANDYITKPVDFPVALARISTQLYLRRVTRELAEANARLHRFSYLDGLTGIPNRRNFDEYLEREWGRAVRESEPLSLILLDVDYFKLYNDNYGHDAGDQVLTRVADALSRALYRQGDMVARYGGEEFVAVLPGTSAEVATTLAERLRQAVAGLAIPHGHHKSEPHVTISLGVSSTIPCAALSPEMLRTTADQALYHAKRQGRNRVGCSGNQNGGCSGDCGIAPRACLPREGAPV